MKTKMPPIWYQKLVELCYVQSHSGNEKLMILYLDKELRGLGLKYTIDNVGNIIITKGASTTYPCIVSHMDTVHSFVDNYKLLLTKKRRLFATNGKVNTGIGGDDKCGIFACLYFLKTLPVVKAVFFTQEETGLKGSNRIEKSFFDDCRYIIQLDRRGCRDFIDTKYKQKTVSHNLSSEIGYIKKEYKFESTEGSITDVINLWMDGIGISCMNISSGYYNPHSNDEYINIDELWHSVMFVKELIKTLKAKIYKSIRKQPIYIQTQLKIYCGVCKKMKFKSMGIYINNKFKCYSCISKENDGYTCKSCYKYTPQNDLRWSTELNCMACSQCRATGNDKRICDVCSKSMYKKYGHENVIGNDTFVCYACYLDRQDEVSKKLTCSVCSKEVDKDKGEYDGELFTCSKCLKKEVYIVTETCDKCYSSVPINRGVYGEMGGTFICYDCIK